MNGIMKTKEHRPVMKLCRSDWLGKENITKAAHKRPFISLEEMQTSTAQLGDYVEKTSVMIHLRVASTNILFRSQAASTHSFEHFVILFI